MNNVPQRLAIDAHVHLHAAGSAMKALADAQRRLAKAAGPEGVGIIMLAERNGFDIFETLRSQLLATDESESLWLDDSRSLLVLAGRQIISSEKLEILALATAIQLPDGLPAKHVLAKLDAADALAVLPWGVGKWIGKRGQLVDGLIASAQPGRLFLGDNGGRPGFWPVRQFTSGLHVLRGTDPLPLNGWSHAIGGFGSIVSGNLSVAEPAASLKQILRNPATSIDRYGKLASPFDFVADQVRLRLAGRGALQ
jgi:hypothetical protein